MEDLLLNDGQSLASLESTLNTHLTQLMANQLKSRGEISEKVPN